MKASNEHAARCVLRLIISLSAMPDITSHRLLRFVYPLFLLIGLSADLPAQGHSVARQWNEVLLDAIRNDFARPTVHAKPVPHIGGHV